MSLFPFVWCVSLGVTVAQAGQTPFIHQENQENQGFYTEAEIPYIKYLKIISIMLRVKEYCN